MIKRNLINIIRGLKKDKSSFFINGAGLSIGLAAGILILLWVLSELRVDTFHATDDRLYQVMEHQGYASGNIFTTTATPGLLAEEIKKEVPEVEKAIPRTWKMSERISDKNTYFTEEGYYVGKDFFNIFSFELLKGDANTVLTKPSDIAISDELAKKLFGTTEVVGQTVEVDNKRVYTVSGIFASPPANSTLQFDYLIPFDDFLKRHPWFENWGNNGPRTVLTLQSDANYKKVSAKISDFIKKRNEGSNVELFLYPFSELYLYGNFSNGVQDSGRIEQVRLFSIIGIFIVLIACINFMNLSTARAVKSARNVGVQKTLGASRKSLIGQYLGESIFISLISLGGAILIVELLLPVFNNLTGKELSIAFGDPVFMGGLLLLGLITGIIAGSYPAFYLSSFNPVEVMKGKIQTSRREKYVRKGLVVFQFSLSVFLIVATFVIYQQLEYVQNKNLGYEKENLVYFPIRGELSESWDTFAEELKSNRDVINISRSNHNFLGRSSNSWDVEWPGKDPNEKVLTEMVRSDYDLIETLGVEMAAGRSFSRNFGADSTKILINEALLDIMGLKNPIGEQVKFWGKTWQIAGVMKNFHYASLRTEIEPMIVFLVADPANADVGFVRIRPGATQQVLADLKDKHATFNPAFDLQYSFIDQQYASLHESEQRMSILSQYFSGLAILISCLGLFGLSIFMAESKTREIGIRKVLGATVKELVLLFTGEFTKLVMAAIFIALPVSWYLMKNWLENFTYHTGLEIWIFLAATAISLIIAWLTVSYQAIRAASVNPVYSLRKE